ncbi:MAG: Yip1 family protein [Lachnospiraceae bacterium]|nr:Yip1 family protein [uncultured Agathobacter sp.]MDD6137948.1 Yip1 family protein [Lachnospiraceae bacterium]MDY6155014.1 Yip1 family protein [Agathobacter sp.]
MKFCQYCGKQLADNEECTCQQNASQGQQQSGTAYSQPVNGQYNASQSQDATQQNVAGQQNTQGQYGNTAGQYNAQGQYGNTAGQYNAQGQYGNATGQYSAQGQQYNTAQNQYTGQNQQSKENEAINDITKLVKGILDTPVAAVSEFVKKSNITACVILIAIYSAIELVLALISIADTSIKTAVYSWGHSHISIGTVFSTIFSFIGCEIIQVLIMAVVIMVVLNAMQKNKNVSFVQTLSVACLYNIVYLPIVLIANVVGLIPFNLFGHIDSWIVSFAAAIGYVYTFFGIREIEEDDNKMPIVFGLATVASAVCSTVVGLIL